MVRLILKKIRGTILEPLIALMIMLFSLTAAFTVVIQANQRTHIPQHIRAQQLAASALNDAIHNRIFLNNEIQEEGLRLEKQFEWYDRENGLLICTINVYDNKNELLANRTRIVIYYENKKE